VLDHRVTVSPPGPHEETTDFGGGRSSVFARPFPAVPSRSAKTLRA
jgi:hypothetical protein